MRNPWLLLFTVALVAIAAHPAMAQGVNPYDVSWAALDPGQDWSAQVLRSIFPIPGSKPGMPTGNEATVIQQIVGQFTGFIGAIACAFVAYNVIMNIHRAAETSRILGNGQTWMFVVRVGFAAVLMFPLGGGFSAGQAMVMQGAMWGVGMAKALYTNAVTAIGPDAMVLAMPMIPGTGQIVSGLIDNELCMDLVNLASGTMMNEASGNVNPPSKWLVQPPTEVPLSDGKGGGTISYRYSMSVGNESGAPVCGTVSVDESSQNMQPVAGVSVDMAAVQQAALANVLQGSIRNQVQAVAENLWLTKNAAALVPLQSILTSAVSNYTAALTNAASNIRSATNAALNAQTQQERNGAANLPAGQQQQAALGWTAAGSYYLQIAQANASTMSLLEATPFTTPPTYQGLPPSISYDLAPMETAATDFMGTLNAVVKTSDGFQTPTGTQTLAGATKDQVNGVSLITNLFGQLNLSKGVLSAITTGLLPQNQWTDPFGALMNLGQTLIDTTLAAMGSAALLASGAGSWGAAALEGLMGNIGGAIATIAGHAVMSFIGTPIFIGLLALLVPGLTIAYVLPMIPWVMWMAGVCGWIILVCEAMIAVPLWMLAHMTLGGDGLHGRAIEGWSLLFNVVFRPVLMVIGLFLGYFVFDCMSWLIRETFGVAAASVLQNGWIVTNFLGLGVLLSIFVMTHVVAALMSFRMIALLPHHLPRLIGFTSASRVDMEDFQQRAAWGPGGPGGQVAGFAGKSLRAGGDQFAQRVGRLSSGSARYISGPKGASGEGAEGSEGMDSTLGATSNTSGSGEEGGGGDV